MEINHCNRILQCHYAKPLKHQTRIQRLLSLRCNYPVIDIPKADLYRFGDSNNARPVFKNLIWRIREGEGWAIVGPAGSDKTSLVEMFLGHLRLHPSPPFGLYPFLSKAEPPKDAHDCIAHVSFATRRKASGGGFYDYTARYGAVREEDRITLRQSLFAEIEDERSENELETLTERLDLKNLLDLPLVALSNGQTRRARIVQELLKKPEILLLNEPLTGLDVEHRPKLLRLLGEIHDTRRPRIIMALRPQDPLPDWITHIALVDGNQVLTGSRDVILPSMEQYKLNESSKQPIQSLKDIPRKIITELKNVNVRYHERHVLKDINWTIREGDRWHLQGANGSGKTTLLSLLTGDHPQSYIQSHLILFNSPRRRQPTASLQRLIGSVSPEIYNAFPRRIGPSGLSVRDAIATGFDNAFSYRSRTLEMDARIDELLEQLGPTQWGAGTSDYAEFDSRQFATLSPGEQSMVLLLRALVNKPSLLILDEVFSGMDSRMITVAKTFLRDSLDGKQAVIFVSHWEEEVPWHYSTTHKLLLEKGIAKEIQAES